MARFLRKVVRKLGFDIQRLEHANFEERVIKDLLKAEKVNAALDVGANVGQWAELLLECGFSGEIISFEAMPDVHSVLMTKAARTSPRWKVAPCSAVGRNKGETEFYIAANSVSSSALPMNSAHLSAAPESGYVRTQRVPMDTLDSLTAGLVNSTDPLLLKVDTQGYEIEVLSGATEILKRTRLLQLELSLVKLYDGAPDVVEVFDFVQNFKFNLFGLIPNFRDQSTGRLLQVDGFFIRS